MPNSLTASIRRQITKFNPDLPDSVSISELRKQLAVSRPSYLKVKKLCLAEGKGALIPQSQVPKNPAKFHWDQATLALLRLRE